MKAAVLVVLVACGTDTSTPTDAVDDAAADTSLGDLFGEPCTQPTAPAVGICHGGEGACDDETAGAVCRPFCDLNGVSQCAGRNGVETPTDRGACVCTPP